MSSGLLILRLVLGLTMAAHGVQKLFGLQEAATAFESLGFVPGRRNALLAGLAEAVGGLMLALGFITPGAAAAVAGVMLVAAVSVHWKNGFFLTKGGYEYTLVLGLSALSLAFIGPGRLSVDALLGLELDGVRWGIIAVVAALVGGGIQLAARQRPVTSIADR